eukprot:14409309-Ditylum_brightwellii.AAC.1
MTRNKNGNPVRLVLAPWFDQLDTKPIPYSAPGNMATKANQLQWADTRELLYGGYFNFRDRDDIKVKRRNVNIRILFNGMISDRDNIRKNLQVEMRRVDMNAQLWFSCLQASAVATQVGYFFYSTPTFDLSMNV